VSFFVIHCRTLTQMDLKKPFLAANNFVGGLSNPTTDFHCRIVEFLKVWECFGDCNAMWPHRDTAEAPLCSAGGCSQSNTILSLQPLPAVPLFVLCSKKNQLQIPSPIWFSQSCTEQDQCSQSGHHSNVEARCGSDAQHQLPGPQMAAHQHPMKKPLNPSNIA